ncbi:MAG: thioredoxin fold domain-containing protein [Phycisphaera sp.]|nr:thioredoxin fold domain-containing protein [Phycisphaera sp.]
MTRRRLILAAMTASLFAGAAGLVAQANAAKEEAKSDWTENYADAVAESKKTHKPILANFTGSDWCGWCIKLHKEVFSTNEFNEWAKDNVVLLTVDFPQSKKQSKELKKQNKGLADKYNIEGFPTILFLDAEGKKLGESGYMRGGPKAWIANAKEQIGAAKPAE